jgi:hypothetical protein
MDFTGVEDHGEDDPSATHLAAAADDVVPGNVDYQICSKYMGKYGPECLPLRSRGSTRRRISRTSCNFTMSSCSWVLNGN